MDCCTQRDFDGHVCIRHAGHDEVHRCGVGHSWSAADDIDPTHCEALDIGGNRCVQPWPHRGSHRNAQGRTWWQLKPATVLCEATLPDGVKGQLGTRTCALTEGHGVQHQDRHGLSWLANVNWEDPDAVHVAIDSHNAPVTPTTYAPGNGMEAMLEQERRRSDLYLAKLQEAEGQVAKLATERDDARAKAAGMESHYLRMKDERDDARENLRVVRARLRAFATWVEQQS